MTQQTQDKIWIAGLAAMVGFLAGLLLSRAVQPSYDVIEMRSQSGTISRCVLSDAGEIACVPTYIAKGYLP